MNERGDKKILFNKSSLLSLKAELLKKQEEVQEKKHLPQNKLENFTPAKASKDTEEVTKRFKNSLKNKLKRSDSEELEACRKAKLVLEQKTKLYEHLADKVGTSQLSGRFLVDFRKKKEDSSDVSEPDDFNEEGTEIGQEEWAEFTDCLGRSRLCLKTDLELYAKRDKELLTVTDKGGRSSEPVSETKNEEPKPVEKPLLVQKTNDYLQTLRDKWEQKERELLAKDKDIHYQDLLFDEARMHGVGYFSFSTDEGERRKQMEELKKTREETLMAQQEAELARKERDELVAARIAATRARQRARAGLPPEEPKTNEKDFTTCLLEFLTQQRSEADAKAKEEEMKAKEEEEKVRQKLREAYVREWDIGKEGVEDKLKKFKEMTQDEYVDQQRSKRIDEFAPPQASTSHASDNTFDSSGKMVKAGSSKSWSEVRPKAPTPPPPDIRELNNFVDENKGLYFTSKKKQAPETVVKYKNFVPQQPVPIENELSDEESDKSQLKRKCSNSEVAPPPTYDYYGPVPKQAKPKKPFESDIREAYDQGTKSLESKSKNKKLPQHYDFTFD